MAPPFGSLLARAYVPYSRTPNAAVAVLADGRWVPGVRVENASFPLTIPAVTAALVGAQAAVGLRNVVGVLTHRPMSESEHALVSEALGHPIQNVADAPEVGGFQGVVVQGRALLPLRGPVEHEAPAPGEQPSPAGLMEHARNVAQARARVPHSDFPVGCVVTTTDGHAVAGVNVEFDDWTRGLCAERSALALTLAYGLSPAALFVSCVKVPGGTPCGACRQVIAELVPNGPIWIDRHETPPLRTSMQALLPDAFVGASLRHPTADR